MKYISGSNGIKVIPFRIRYIVQDEIGTMGNVSLNVCQLAPMLYLSVCEVIQLALMDMDFGVWKIRQPADVVKVHVSNDDVFHIFRFVSQLFDPIDGGFIGIERHLSNNAK